MTKEEKKKLYAKQYYEKNKEKIIEYTLKRYNENKEEINNKNKERYRLQNNVQPENYIKEKKSIEQIKSEIKSLKDIDYVNIAKNLVVNNPTNKDKMIQVYDSDTEEIYSSIVESAKIYNVSYEYLWGMLNGKRKNKFPNLSIYQNKMN